MPVQLMGQGLRAFLHSNKGLEAQVTAEPHQGQGQSQDQQGLS
jgi:hypothetical protein